MEEEEIIDQSSGPQGFFKPVIVTKMDRSTKTGFFGNFDKKTKGDIKNPEKEFQIDLEEAE
jgi:hypothetical protein